MLLAKEGLGLAEPTEGDGNGDLVLEDEESDDGYGESSSGFDGVGLQWLGRSCLFTETSEQGRSPQGQSDQEQQDVQALGLAHRHMTEPESEAQILPVSKGLFAAHATRVDSRDAWRAELVDGARQHPLPNRGTGEHVVDEMRRTLDHATPSAARAKASAFARKRNQPIGAAARTRKPGKAMREDAAANESLKLALHEQRSAALVALPVELPKEGPQVLDDDAVEHPMLRRTTHVGSRNRLARRGVKLHDYGTPSRLVPLSAKGIPACL